MASSNFQGSRFQGSASGLRQPRFGSPVRAETETGILNMMNDLIREERQVEQAKGEAASMSDFNMFDAFRIFDVDGVGSITANDLKHGLADVGVHASIDDINCFVARFDRDGDRRLSFREFSEALLPQDSYYAAVLERKASSHRPINPYRKDDIFSHPTACSFKNLMRAQLACENRAESLRQCLSRNPYFDPTEAFKICDLNQNGLVSAEEIRYLMESRGFFISNQEAQTVAKKFDKNGDGVITYNEFMTEVRPKSPQRRY